MSAVVAFFFLPIKCLGLVDCQPNSCRRSTGKIADEDEVVDDTVVPILFLILDLKVI